MKSLIKSILIIGFCIISVITKAQKGSEPNIAAVVPKAIIPPSPEGASLGKYGELPLSLYKGNPEISIPIYNISIGDIQIPISINWSNSGIKVNQEATNVGLGWTLLAGGGITRTIKDKDDNSHPRNLPIDYQNFNPYYTSGGANTDYNFANNYVKNQSTYDLQADDYFYYFCGKSGRFFMDYDNQNGYAMPRNDLKIYHDAYGTHIIDAKGVKYLFNQSELTVSEDSVITGNPRTTDVVNAYSTTYLTSIKDLKGDSVSFEYENSNSRYFEGISEINYLLIPAGNCNQKNPVKSVNMKEVFGKRLTRIYVPQNQTEILFIYENLKREDLLYPLGTNTRSNALKEIDIKESGVLIKRFFLYHDYFRSTNYDPNGDDQSKYYSSRLKLTSIQEEGKPAYQFSYNESIPFPDKLSNAIDFWGYYNGASNTTTIPSNSVYGFSGANRSPNPTYGKLGLLTQVIYPTGGRTMLVYEPNIVTLNNVNQIYGGFRVHQTVDYPLIGSSVTKTYLYVPGDDINSSYSSLSGFNLNENTFHKILNVVSYDQNGLQHTCSYQVLYSNPMVSAIGSDYNNFGYRRVTILTDGQGLKGKEVKSFTLGVNDFNNPYNNNTGLINAYTFLGGLPLKSEIYSWDTNLNNFKIQKRTIDNYTNNYSGAYIGDNTNSNRPPNQFAIYGLTIDQTVPEANDPLNQAIYHPAEFSVSLIPSVAAWMYKSNETSYTYNPSDTTQYITEAITYNYGNPKHFQITSLTKTKSNQTTDKTTYRYPDDLVTPPSYIVDASNPLSFMIQNHDIAEPVETINSTVENGNESITGATLTTYQGFGSTRVLPKEYKTLIIPQKVSLSSFQPAYVSWSGSYENLIYDSRYSKDYSVDDYNQYGKVKQITLRNYLKTTYLWGYNKEYPIAEIKNAEEGEVHLSDFEEGSDFDGTLVMDNTKSHSGVISGRIDNNSGTELTSFNYNGPVYLSLSAPKKFTYSGWIYSTGPTTQIFLFMYRANETGYFTYIDNIDCNVVGQWVYVQKTFTVPSDVVRMNLRLDNNGDNGGGSAWFDDLRIYPTDSQMTTYTYKPLVGMTSMTDAAGHTTYYEYDSFQRLLNVKDQDGHILKHYEYHYQNQ